MFLTDSQLRELTGRQKYRAQERVLAALGIPYRRRPDGSLVVLQVHVTVAQDAGD